MSAELTPRSRTIDNLGIESSERYAKDQEYFDQKILTDANYVPKSTLVQVAKPTNSELDAIFETTQRNKNWGGFNFPPQFSSLGSTCFSFQLLPSVGAQEMMLSSLQRVSDKIEKEKKATFDGNPEEKNDFDLSVTQTISDGQKITKLLETIINLDKILTNINAQRNRYQRG